MMVTLVGLGNCNMLLTMTLQNKHPVWRYHFYCKNKHSLPCISLTRPLIKKAYKQCKAQNIYCTVFAQATGQQIFVEQYLHKNFVVPYLCVDTLFWSCHSECSWIYQWQRGALQQLQSTNTFKYVVLKLLQWKPLIMITLGPALFDNNNWQITLSAVNS